MKQLAIYNPFNAPVYYEDTVDSTMNVSRVLAGQGEPHGTVITADFQEAGRGRIKGRPWDMEKGTNLAFTILLRFSAIPPALTLRAGLAVSRAIEDFAPVLAGRIQIKWPNDILIAPLGDPAAGKKAVGILAEADGTGQGVNGFSDIAYTAHIGIGINVAQHNFPGFLREKATSISLAADRKIADGEQFALLEKILVRLHDEIEAADGKPDTDWRGRIEERLYKKGEQVCFICGPADSGETAHGILSGIGPDGELRIAVSGAIRSFTAGELSFSC